MEFDSNLKGFKGQKKAFLDQKKKEKQQKEELKAQILAVQRIQAFWRFKRIRTQELVKIIAQFNLKIKDVKKVTASLTPQQLSSLSGKILNLYPIFLDPISYLHDDNCIQYQQVILDLAILLFQASTEPIMNNFKSTPNKFQYVYKIVMLSMSLISKLPQEHPSLAKLDQFLAAFYRNCKKNEKRVLFPLYLLKDLASKPSNLQCKGVKKTIKNQCFSIPNNQIIFHCLSIEGSMKQLLNNQSDRAKIIFNSITQENLQNNKVTKLHYLRNRVANYIQIWSLIDGQSIQENLLQQFSIVLMGSLEKIIKESKLREDEKSKNEMEIEQQVPQGEDSLVHSTFYRQYSDTLSTLNLSEFSTPKAIQLFTSMINRLVEAKPLLPSSLEKVSQICGQFLMMCKIRNEFQLGFKIKLAQSFQFIRCLFNVVSVLGFDLSKFRVHSKSLSNVIELFCLLFKKKLSLVDDEEFFFSMGMGHEVIIVNANLLNSQNFNLQEMKQIISFLNVFSFRLLFVEGLSDYKKCENKIVKLLKQLYSRDQRRSFYQDWVLKGEDCQKLLGNFDFKRVDDQNIYMSRLLNKIPHIFTFEQRYTKMKALIRDDQQHQDRNPFQFYNPNNNDEEDEDQENDNLVAFNSKNIFIKRGDELNEAFSKFHRRNMKSLYKITFVDEHGFVEEGIDGGGIIKEFINSVARQGFDPTNGLFIETAERTLMPAPNNRSKYARYKFLGQIVGKAIYEDILIEPVFSKVFLNQILEKPSTLEDLQFVDKSLYKTLMNLKHTSDDVENYGLVFSIDDPYNGTVELKFNGQNTPVTKQELIIDYHVIAIIVFDSDNKFEYISLYAQYKLNQMNQFEADSFRQGFASVIDQDWLSMFNHDELQLIISGKFSCFEVEDLQQHTSYKGYKQFDLTIVLFWEVLKSFTDEEKAKFLHFATSCSRPPTLGFKQLNPPFCIQISIDDNNRQFPEKLPTSSTCMNILKLPDYKDPNKLKIKLLEAIFSGAGFDLS